MIIRIYQCVISPLFPRCCRYTPSCSRYAIDAIKTHGLVRGGVLSAWRIVRCNPFLQGGYDPVPPKHHLMDVFSARKGEYHE
jgi:putative membrane protein insertion efficiency factor